MTRDVEQLANELVRLLEASGQRADRFTTGPGTAGINVWGEEGRYPLTSVTISDSGKFHYEHTLPIDTPPSEVAAAVSQSIAGESPR